MKFHATDARIPCSGFTYHCENCCSFNLHIQYSIEEYSLNLEVHKQHPLTYSAWPPNGFESFLCNMGDEYGFGVQSIEDGTGEFYCSICEKRVHEKDVAVSSSDLFDAQKYHDNTSDNRLEMQLGKDEDEELAKMRQSLLSSYPDYGVCDACGHTLEGFTYTCKSCYFNLHFICASIPRILRNAIHQQPIILCQKTPYSSKCSCFKEDCIGIVFECEMCNLVLDFKSALLPHKIKHDCHIDPLVLTCLVEDEEDEYYCNACEEGRQPNLLAVNLVLIWVAWSQN
ncbi:hypothetical protein ACH5RR_031479 [Cinchona calisaya]|uniref:C2H2-type domain-containing protein n=1 Tax=Cinchona calisaya TaxID=153742 RepID=A0ABD2YFD5_9GENT